MSETIPFPNLGAKRLPTPRLLGDRLADISRPEALEAIAMQQLIAALVYTLQTFGVAKTIDLVADAMKEARSRTNE